MATIHDTRLPVDIERGAKGGPGFLTTITSMESGAEQRNQEWSVARGEWDVSYGIRKAADMDAVTAFFYARRGRVHGFRFKDWLDYKVVANAVGTTGNVLTRQLQKSYPDTVSGYIRRIVLPVEDTLIVYVNDIATEAYTLGADGIITFAGDPGGNVKATFEFDVPVRFDIDRLDASAEWVDAVGIASIPIVELR